MIIGFACLKWVLDNVTVSTKQQEQGKGYVLGNRMERTAGALVICPIAPEDKEWDHCNFLGPTVNILCKYTLHSKAMEHKKNKV